MHGITRFNANGQTFDIPETAAPDFLKDAPVARRTRRFTAGGNTYDIPDGEAEAFLKDAPDAVETRTIVYRGADGTDKTVDIPLSDMPKFLRENYNRDDEFAHDRERTRKDIEANVPKPDESPIWSGVKAFGEGLVRSVTDSANLWRETYGDGPVTDALLGANANANKVVNGILGIPEDIESVASMALGGENTAAGKWLKEDAKAGRAYLDEHFPSRISEAVGREDWGTIAGDKIGDISATIIKFAAGDKDPTKLFNTLVVSSAAADSYAQTYDNAIAHGKSVEDANYLANGSAVWNALLTMFLMRAFKGETAAVQRELGNSVKEIVKREAKHMASTGNVMGVQAAGNKAIETNTEGRNVTAKELATAYVEGMGEGALFHGMNMLGAQISEYGHNAERRAEWVNEFRDHIINSQSDREIYLNTPMGDPMRAICESVQNGTLPDRKAFVSAGIPKELCKTEAQRREIAQKFIDTIGITADAQNARAAQNVLDIANMMSDADPIAMNAYREWRDVVAANTVQNDVRLWNGKKIVAERVDMGDGRYGYDIYHDAGDGTRQLITTSDEPLLFDAYADARADMNSYFGIEEPKRSATTFTAEPRKFREEIEDTIRQKREEQAKEAKNEEQTDNDPQAVDKPVSGEPAPAEAGRRDEGVAAGDGADAASPRGTAETVAAPETPAPSAEATLERGAQDALAAALDAVKPTVKKRPGKVAAKEEEPVASTPDKTSAVAEPVAQEPSKTTVEPSASEPVKASEPTAPSKPQVAPKEQPKALAAANAEAKTADARRAARMETAALEDEIATLESIGNISKKRQRQLDAYKAELAKRTDADKAAKAEAFNAPAFEVGANGEKVAIGPKAEPAAEPAPAAPKRRPGKKTETATAPVDAQYDRAVKAVESAEKESANARSFDELSNIHDRARSALGKITMEQENELMARLDKAFYDNQGRVGNVRSQGGYTPSREIIEAKSRIESMPTSTSREKAAKKKAQKDWLLSSVDDDIKSHGDTRTINGKPFAESFADEFESLLRRRDATYDIKKSEKLDEQIAAAKKTIAQGEMLTFDVPDDGTFKIRNNPEALAVFKRMVQKRLSPTNLKEGTLAKAEKPLAEDVKEANIGEKQAEQPKESRRGPTVDAAKLEDPAFREWSQKRGTKADDAEALARDRVAYDLDQATDAAKRTGNWLGVKVVRETNADAMPEGAKASIVTDPDILAQFENPDGTITVFRAVQVNEKGEVRPPQSTRIEGADGKLADRPAEGYVDKDGNIRAFDGGTVVIKAEERPDLAHRVKGKNGEWKKFTEKDAKDGKCPPEMVGQDKWFFDLKKAKGTGSTDNVVYDPYMHSSDTPLNDQFSSAHKRPDWKVAVCKILKSDLESGYRAEKAGLSVGAHEWKGGAVDNQLPKDAKRRVFLTRHLKMERILTETEAAKYLKKKWGEMGKSLEIPDERVSPAVREALIKEGFNVVKTGNVKYLKGANGQVVGWYDPATKEVHLKPGADAKTVAHEVGWHATYDWAKANHPTLAKTMEQYAANAPEALKAEIKKLYGRDLTPAELVEEIGAGRFEREHGKKLQKLLADRANRTWYRKVWDGIKDAYKAVLTKLGFNRVDLDEALKDKTPEQAMDFLASALARGKALGKMRPGKVREGARPMAAITPVVPVGPVDPQTKLNKKELLVRSIKDSDIALRKMDELDGRYANGDYADNSIHLAKKLLPGDRERAIHRRDFYEQSIAKIMREHKITVNDIDDYLLSVAVPERNARLAAKGITDGAGLTDADAAALDANLRATLTSAQYAQVQRCAHILWAMQQEGMAARIASGRVAQDVYDTWNAAEPHHIPMRTDRSELADIDAHNYSTGGYKRNDFMTAKGRRTRASSPTAFIFDEYTDARLSSLDNDLRVKLADFVRQHPEIGKIAGANRADNGYVILNGESGSGLKIEPKREQYGHRPQKGEDPNLILFKEGGILKAIELNGDFGTQIADAITDRQIWDFSGWGPEVSLLKFGAKDATGKRHFVQKTEKRAIGDWLKSASSAYASTATRWSPTFMARNFVKDQIELNLQNLAEYGFVGGAKAAKNQLVNSIGSVREINRYLGSKEFDTSTEEGKWLKRYVEAGGLIGGAGSEGYTEFKRRFDGFSQATEKGKARKIVDAIVRANEISEMMNRLANFRTACENGMGDRQAALKSRNDSVDFNSFGRAKWMNTVWNFSNSVTGGTMRQAYYLSRKHGRKLAASLFAYGFAEGLAEVLMNMDDDERETEGLPSETSMSEYQRANAAYVRRGDKFYRLPIHAGIFSTFKYAGNGAARMMFGKLNWEEYANALYGEARDTLKHFTGTGDVAGGDSTIGTLNIGNRGGKFAPLPNLTQSFSPSMLQGPVQRYDYGPNSPIEAGTGLTFAGTPLRDRSFNPNEPQAYNGREMTAAPYKWAAQALNAMSGGNEHRKGNWDMAPEDIKVIMESLGKNVLKDAANAVNLLSLLTNEGRADFRVGNIPFVGDFVRNVPENDTRYYAAMDRLSADQNEYKNLQGAEKQAFGRSHKLVNRTSHPTYDKKGRITGFAEDKTEAERLVDQIKDERNLVRSGKIEESNPVYDRRGKIVRFRHDKVEHAYTPDEREQAERTRRKKQAKFIRLTREDDASK